MRREWTQWWRKSLLTVLPGAAVIFATAFLQTFPVPVVTPVVERVGLTVFDSYQRISPRPYEDAPVRVVDIDDETIRRYGQWPWPRTDLARLTMALGEAGAAAIAYDIVFSEKDRTSPRELARRFEATDPAAARVLDGLPDNDEQFAKVAAYYPTVMGFFLTSRETGTKVEPKAGMVVLGTPPASVPDFDSAITPVPVLMNAAPGAASLSIVPDQDSIIRKAPLIQRQGDMMLPTLSVEAIRLAFQTDSVIINTTDGSREGSAPGDVVSLKVGDIEVPTTADGQLWMHYTRDVPERVVPAWKVLSGALDADAMEQAFGGRIVFVGTSAIGLRDLRSTPLKESEMGVMIHAEATEQMILGKFLRRPDWAVGLERTLLLICSLGLVVLLPRLGAARGAALGLVAIAGMAAGSWYAFTTWGYLLDPTWPVIAMVLSYLVVTILIFYREEQQRSYIHRAFDRYLAPELVKRIAADPTQLNLGGEERDMTVLFCDVRSFSSISEGLSPDEIIRFLITFLTPMTDLMIERKATIDKYIGDAILAFWNAPLDDPEHEANAARSALAMVDKLVQLNAEMPQRDDVVWPGEVKIGIGLNAGPCCVGNMGSERRLSYSLIGDTVNLASRIEGLTKYYGVQIAIGSSLARTLQGFAMVELDLVRVVGRETPEAVFVLLGDEALGADATFRAFAAEHAAMLAAYRARDWAGAEAMRAGLAERAGDWGLGKLYDLYRERIVLYRQNDPGEDWDGVYRAENK
ncbi:CHASE2 domain-containing protein [Novosphingobium mangrovi (ex Huang et al. 2023)]|uniref:Adenylate/guanylate cyclase domain-containing protein n=1 Tax=Novosphingobium mangrovi (ex Huang et al. 2023) TaxID=2976432 RepID=A0ABT2I9R4_9SPHN|nr:adenylate/guanylate cyclase domain-containing protein [Novosphingobium mangrovi (ex Huang et al. 2023)]MCT2401546.1 adenylate/guanylate cyclase domain-containing protein [Novosphingobium mangrovi (ex Huang et al. 2023)]